MGEEKIGKPIYADDSKGAQIVPSSPSFSSSIPTGKDVTSPYPSYMFDPLFHKVSRFLGLDPQDYRSLSDRVSVVVDWASKQSNSMEYGDILSQIRGLEKTLYFPSDEKRFSVIYRHVALLAKQEQIGKELEANKL